MSTTSLGLAEAADLLARGQISCRQLVDDCLARIEEFEPTLHAWAHLDADYARRQADALDRHRKTGKPLGPLHGVPVGVKDIVDTTGLPCELGSPVYAGRKPGRDAALVAKLRQAGAVVMGKTVTTEFASYHPAATANPHDPAHTPGGSSSGSAAAVAAHMVPGAIGSQTNASVIRPASFCGIVGFKPSRGVIGRTGVMTQSQSLDQMGVFTRSIGDAALLADALAGFDEKDPETHPPGAHPGLAQVAAEPVPVAPRLAFVKPPMWDKAEPAMRTAIGELAEALGDRADWVALPDAFENAVRWHATVMEAEIARNFHRECETGGDAVSEAFRAIAERGRGHAATAYIAALEARDGLNGLLSEIFETYDAIVTPSAPGEAPVGLETTGDPIFGTIWTYLGLPALSLPLFRGENGMPMGAQLAGKPGDDGRLLRTANWVTAKVTGEGETHNE